MTVDLRCGNVLDVLRTMPDESVHCAVTSPPYWGLRAYGTTPQVWLNGHEPCQEHQWGETHTIKSQTQVDFTSSGLKRDGRPEANRIATNEQSSTRRTSPETSTNTCLACGAWRGELGLEPTPEAYCEHLVAIFREVRRVMRDDATLWLNIGDSYAGGGTAGSDKAFNGKQGTNRGSVGMVGKANIPNGLKPKDLVGIPWMVAFALRADGWYLRSDIIWAKPNPMPESVRDRPTKAHEYIFLMSKAPRYYYDADAIREPLAPGSWDAMKDAHSNKPGWSGNPNVHGEIGHALPGNPAGRNKRSVWTVTTKPFNGAHFATFPPDLIEPMILAGCPVGGTVLDPFSGAGTTGVVAVKHGRNYIGIDLKAEYNEMARERIGKVQIELQGAH